MSSHNAGKMASPPFISGRISLDWSMRMDWSYMESLSLREQIKTLYENGTFIMAIRYYGYKVNLYLLGGDYVEVFYNHKADMIERICKLDSQHSRMKFYSDQIKIPTFFNR